MKKELTPRQFLTRLNAICPHRHKKDYDKVEGLALAVANRMLRGDNPPRGYKKNWGYVIMEFYRPVNKAHNDLKGQLRKLGA